MNYEKKLRTGPELETRAKNSEWHSLSAGAYFSIGSPIPYKSTLLIYSNVISVTYFVIDGEARHEGECLFVADELS